MTRPNEAYSSLTNASQILHGDYNNHITWVDAVQTITHAAKFLYMGRHCEYIFAGSILGANAHWRGRAPSKGACGSARLLNVRAAHSLCRHSKDVQFVAATKESYGKCDE